MPASPADSSIYALLLSDPECAALFGDEAEVRAMLDVEIALARVQAALGIVPEDAAAQIEAILSTSTLDPRALAAGTASAGVPAPVLVSEARKVVGGDAARHLHWGATSQDIADTALVLRLRDLLDLLDARLAALCDRLAEVAHTERATVMVARTRSQQATPTTFGLKVAGWLAPLHRHRVRLDELRPRLLLVQLGGASGNLAALGDRGVEVMEALATDLELGAPPMPWHTQRDSLVELAGWLGALTGILGKMGQDLVLLAQSEVGEVRPGAGGGSSTMPQKANPIAPEMLVALARASTHLVGAAHDAMLQEHERGGPGWTLEWMALPQLAVNAGAALRHATDIASEMTADPARMRENLERSGGLVLAEAATFALAEHMPRPQAQALVKDACKEAIASGRHLRDVLREQTDVTLDWDAVFDPGRYVGVAEAFVARVVER
ncbi:MAG: 3-carboxy-cis,cis-muconate cycloisomerase [Ectothiorhodospiraceae bacterium]|nr:3-carboxy-cis,cis-muconate cycloisomerase [Ectothiorhodospiraceae bacterium]